MPRTARTAAAILLCACLCVGLGSRAASGGDPKPARPAADPAKAARDAAQKAFVDRVNAAIDLGQKFLLANQKDDGLWTAPGPGVSVNVYGEQALFMLALAKTGVKADHRQMQKALAALDVLIAKQKGLVFNAETNTHGTYSAACVAMLEDALYAEHPTPGPDGKPTTIRAKVSLPAAARGLLEELVGFFQAKQYGRLWRYPGGQKRDDEDLSATQYALMGLLTAGRLGFHAKPYAYRKALGALLEWQEATGPEVPWMVENPAFEAGDPEKERYGRFVRSGKALARGWPYQKGGPATGSMTCSGLTCLAIVKDRLSDERLKGPDALTKDERTKIDKAIVDGLGWLAANFSVKENPAAGRAWRYYYLYGLERTGSLMGIRFVGTHDWYREGADALLEEQQPGGEWPASGGAENRYVQTSFALLFLKRATSPTRFRAPVVTGGADDEPSEAK